MFRSVSFQRTNTDFFSFFESQESHLVPSPRTYLTSLPCPLRSLLVLMFRSNATFAGADQRVIPPWISRQLRLPHLPTDRETRE